MTDTVNTTPEEYPTKWRTIDALTGVETREIAPGIHELRSHTHIITVNDQGFSLYREDMEEFEKWMDINNVKAYPRGEVEHGTN